MSTHSTTWMQRRRRGPRGGLLVTFTAAWALAASGCGDGTTEGGAQTASNTRPAPEQTPAPEAAAPATETPPSAVGPRITFDRTTHSFGEVWDVKDEQEVAFRFTNTGDEALEIKDVKTSCGCTAAELSRTVFKPGEGDVVRVSYKPKGVGAQQQTVRLMTNMRSDPEVKLNIMARVKPFVTVTPNIVRFEDIEMGKEHSRRFTVVGADPNLVIDGVTTNRPQVAARIVRGGTAGPLAPGATAEPLELEVTIDENATWGNFYSAVTLKTRGRLEPGGPEITHDVNVPVNARVLGELVPDDLMFRVNGVSVGEQFERRIRVTRRTPTPFSCSAEIERCTIKTLSIDVEPVMEPGVFAYDLVLRGDTTNHRGPVRGDVVVHTDVEGEESLKLTIAGRIDGA